MTAWRVLLAEDEALMAQMMADMLTELQVEVSVAHDGREALAMMERVRPDLVLLDCMMPELDGFEVAAALKANPETQDIPIIFLTARGRVEDKVRGLELGAEDYLIKPVRREEMLARVRNVLRRCEARRAAAPPESSLMRGRLEVMGLPNIVQVLETERRTGTLRLTNQGRRGEILFLEGRVSYAVEGTRQGEAAVYRMLAWDKGDFELEQTSGTGPDGRPDHAVEPVAAHGGHASAGRDSGTASCRGVVGRSPSRCSRSFGTGCSAARCRAGFSSW